MNKKLIIGVILVILVIALGVTGYVTTNKNENKDNSTNINEINKEEIENISNEPHKEKESKKILVVYFSAQNHTKSVAEKIAKNLNADLFEIVPEDVYTSDDLNWSNNNSRVSKEHENESLRDVKLINTKVDNWEDYDTVLIGYPIWWGIAAWPVNNFVKDNNFDGKTVIPFCTSSSSSLGQSGKLLKQEAGSGNWQEGHRFSSSASDSDIKNWTDSLK